MILEPISEMKNQFHHIFFPLIKKLYTMFIFSLLRIYEGSGDDNLATLAVFAQEESLEQQLQYGVRGLDIRVGYCKSLNS